MNVVKAMVLVPGSMINLPSFHDRVEQARANQATDPNERTGYVRMDFYEIEAKRHTVCSAGLSLVELVLDTCGVGAVTRANEALAEEVLSAYLRPVLSFFDRHVSGDDLKLFPMGAKDAFLVGGKRVSADTTVYALGLFEENDQAFRLLKAIVNCGSAKVACARKSTGTTVPAGAFDPFSRAITLGALTGSITDPIQGEAENEVAA